MNVEPPEREDFLISGHVVRMIRDEWNLSQAQFAKLVGVSREWVVLSEKLDNRRIRKKTMNLIAERMGVTPREAIGLLYTLSRYSFDRKEREGIRIPGPVALAKDGSMIENVPRVSARQVYAPIPTFELKIHATHWTDTTDNVEMGEFVTEAQRIQGRFRVKVDGDCMAPKYPDGCTVEFRLLDNESGRPNIDACVEGKNYYVQLDDGRATFKQLVEIRPEALILRPLSKKYRKTLEAPIESIQRLGVAEGKFEAD